MKEGIYLESTETITFVYGEYMIYKTKKNVYKNYLKVVRRLRRKNFKEMA